MKQLLSERLKRYGVALMVLLTMLDVAAILATIGTEWLIPILCITVAIAVLGVLACFRLWKPYEQARRGMVVLAEAPSAVGLKPCPWYHDASTRMVAKRLLQVLQESSPFELSKRQAQYLALQNQINPHFLYNTMESIRSEAMMSGLDSVAKMCESLASFFRYTVSNTENLATVEEELQNVRNYFFIQQYRFGSRLQLNIEYEEDDWGEMLKCRIPKLTLQPVVENAIIHGVEQKIGVGTVTVRIFFTETRLVILVKDDGVGIPPEVLAQINNRLKATSTPSGEKGGIAIANVNTRIKLLFGDAYGVTVYSTEGVGTDVEITLPRHQHAGDNR